LKKYLEAYHNIFTTRPISEWTQSNGSLMRCAPLCFFDSLEWFVVDARQSNPHPINQDCNIIYGFALWLAVRGSSRDAVWGMIANRAQTDEVREVLGIVGRGDPYLIMGKGVKGHVLRAF
jgi:hypothetical protein